MQTAKTSRQLKRRRHHRRPLLVLLLGLAAALSSCIAVFFLYNSKHNSTRFLPPRISSTTVSSHRSHHSHGNSSPGAPPPPPTLFPPPARPTIVEALPVPELGTGPYHDWDGFAADFEEMKRKLRIFVYPDALKKSGGGGGSPFANVFLPQEDSFGNPKLGNYLSEHMFKVALLQSPLLTSLPDEAHFFFLPFSINNLRNDRRVRSESSIAEFVARYSSSVGRNYRFWNASGGADHFYACCHSVGREAASRHFELQNNAIQLTCSSSYFQRLYVSHKDVALPQVWPRPHQSAVNPPHARNKLVFFAGRAQNSQVRQQLIHIWGNDSDMDIFSGSPSFPYEEGFQRSKYCLHVKGYEVNTARVSDAIHYGCVPVIVSNYYDLPFANVLDWSKFSVIINQRDIAFLKGRLLGIPKQMYLSMYHNLCKVRRHFFWHRIPRDYDSFYMTAYQLWLRRNIHRLS